MLLKISNAVSTSIYFYCERECHPKEIFNSTKKKKKNSQKFQKLFEHDSIKINEMEGKEKS